MAKIIGAEANIGIAKEAVRGTVETTATFWMPKAELTVDDKADMAIDDSTIGVIEDARCQAVVNKFAEGDFAGSIKLDFMGLLLLSTLGSVSTSLDDPEATVNTHTFNVLQSIQHPSLTLFIADGENDFRHPLGMIASYGISAELDSFIKVNVAFRSKVGVLEGGGLTPVYSTDDFCGFIPKDMEFKVATDVAGLDGASAIGIRTIDFTIEKNVEDDRVLGSVDPVDINNKQMSIEGSMEIVFDDTIAQAFKDDMLGDIAKAMRIKMVNSDVTIGATSNPTLQFDFNKVKFTEFTRNYGNGDIVTASVSFKALYKQSEAKMIEAVIINTVDSY
ncbi:MAG: hypothetical protein KAS32_00115 [Candidatus Peribacteraceae bacterium]|nr:hypothetical protein [Candidatus Peribacteraceae bacterium]